MKWDSDANLFISAIIFLMISIGCISRSGETPPDRHLVYLGDTVTEIEAYFEPFMEMIKDKDIFKGESFDRQSPVYRRLVLGWAVADRYDAVLTVLEMEYVSMMSSKSAKFGEVELAKGRCILDSYRGKLWGLFSHSWPEIPLAMHHHSNLGASSRP